MALKNKITILSLLAALFLSPPLVAAGKDETQSVDVEPFLPVWALEQHELTVVSVAPLVVGDKTVGAVTVYDDATTERPVDYWELYDSEGDLLAARWFDRFGIKRTAVDRGVLDRADKPEGILVVIVDGDLV
ncbi:MAG TPA: hypothetical protein VE616_19000 [Candidatus Udaeobacter sp.]|jgi:hypothetical protein|nr:hypothetical protein [Candidatus Udaeobacter sp.]